MHDVDFGQRSRLALTHPVTLAALGVLLLNDLVFKSLWANPWTTGKLSDLAWVVFASPLLAFLLSLLVRDNRRGQRAAFVIAYVGLPLLYAAYNTFAPVHDVIIWGLSLLSGATSGSPLDPTDSLVIPVGLAVALWVWRRGGRDSGGAVTLRQRIVLVAAALATIASIATSPGPAPTEGITVLAASDSWSDKSNAIFAGYHRNYALSDPGGYTPYSANYVSTTGGLTWNPVSRAIERSDTLSQQSVDTPRGRFEIGESGIKVVSGDGSASVVYSTGHLRGSGSNWVQRQTTSHLAPRVIATDPYGILYDPQSDNVIVAMGIQGVVVGTPNGEWTTVAVGPYRPTDFSFISKVRTLLSTGAFWVIILTLVPPVATAVIALAGVLNRRGSASRSGDARKYIALAISVIALPIAAYQLAHFSQPYDPFNTSLAQEEIWRYLQVIALIVVNVLAVTAFCLCVHMFEHLSSSVRRSWVVSIIVASLAMIAEIFLMLVIWVQINVSTDFVIAGILILVMATGAVLLLYLTSPRRSEAW